MKDFRPTRPVGPQRLLFLVNPSPSGPKFRVEVGEQNP